MRLAAVSGTLGYMSEQKSDSVLYFFHKRSDEKSRCAEDGIESPIGESGYG